jgi:hypothetical protein
VAHVNIVAFLSHALDECRQGTVPSWDDVHTLAQITTQITWDSKEEQKEAADLVMLIIAHHGSIEHKKALPHLDNEETLNELCELLRNILQGAVKPVETASPPTSE